MRAFFGVIGKQLFLSLGQSRRAPAEIEKDISQWLFALCREGLCCGFKGHVCLCSPITFYLEACLSLPALSCDSFRNLENCCGYR